MKRFRKAICWLFGHRSICLHRNNYLHNPDAPGRSASSSVTGWKCERCGAIFDEGWDE